MSAATNAETASEAWRAAVTTQRVAVPDHTDFYNLAAEIVPTLHSLQDLANVLCRQVACYGEGGAIYEDSRQVNPRVRLADAAERLAQLRDSLAAAQEHANGFWSAIAHIGIEAQP